MLFKVTGKLKISGWPVNRNRIWIMEKARFFTLTKMKKCDTMEVEFSSCTLKLKLGGVFDEENTTRHLGPLGG